MRKFMFTLLLGCVCACVVHAGGVGIGMRDARYFNIHYTFRDRYYAELEQSAYSAVAGMQKTRLYFGYQRDFAHIGAYVRPYTSVYWNGDYDLGARISASYRLRRLYVGCILDPHYDNSLGFEFRYRFTASLRVFRHTGLFGYYTTIPPYRTPEKIAGAGIWVRVGQLAVAPSIALPFGSPERYIRVFCDMNYEF